jgi:deoxyribose-phosphate aldolase
MSKFSKLFDHTNLHANASEKDIKKLCDEAKEYQTHSVCINPSYVSFANEQLKDTDVKVCTVIGFPLGATPSEVKAFETTNAIGNGADEIDMVINIGAMKSGNYEVVEDDIRAVVNAATSKLVKVILETCYLTDQEVIKACSLAKAAKADFVKTSTGFGPEGAKIDHIRLMKKAVGEQLDIKASGGIRTYKKAKKMVDAGATRIGASASVKIIKEYKESLHGS